MGQAVFKRIQFPCNYFGVKLAIWAAGCRGHRPATPSTDSQLEGKLETFSFIKDSSSNQIYTSIQELGAGCASASLARYY